MAIVKCLNCGKQISDRSKKCPFCDAIFIGHQEKEKMSMKEEKIISKKNIIGSACAAIIFYVAYYITNLYYNNILCAFGIDIIIKTTILFCGTDILFLPLLQSALFLLTHGKKLKKVIIYALAISLSYIILSVILLYLTVCIFQWGFMWIGLTKLIVGILFYIIIISFLVS